MLDARKYLRNVILMENVCCLGSLNGSLSSLAAHELGAQVIKEALKRGNVQPDAVSEVILGQVLTAGRHK